jgi:hypothetical protein
MAFEPNLLTVYLDWHENGTETPIVVVVGLVVVGLIPVLVFEPVVEQLVQPVMASADVVMMVVDMAQAVVDAVLAVADAILAAAAVVELESVIAVSSGFVILPYAENYWSAFA